MSDDDRFARSTFAPTLAFIALSLFLIHFGTFLARQTEGWTFGHQVCERGHLEFRSAHADGQAHEHFWQVERQALQQVERHRLRIEQARLHAEAARLRADEVQLHVERLQRAPDVRVQVEQLPRAPAGHIR